MPDLTWLEAIASQRERDDAQHARDEDGPLDWNDPRLPLVPCSWVREAFDAPFGVPTYPKGDA